MTTYWTVFGLGVVAFACEIAVFVRQNMLAKRRSARQLRRNINRYHA